MPGSGSSRVLKFCVYSLLKIHKVYGNVTDMRHTIHMFFIKGRDEREGRMEGDGRCFVKLYCSLYAQHE